MTPGLPGVGGTLFPSRFLASLTADTPAEDDVVRRRFLSWWLRIESSCGPATGMRSLFDLFAMPLAGLLGFRAFDAVFDRDRVSVTLRSGTDAPVRLVLLPWARRPSREWRDLGADSPVDVEWCLLVAPPFVSVVLMRGHAFRRSADFRLPDALDKRSFNAFVTVCRAATLGGSEAGRLLIDAARFRDGVRDDLQSGVVTALAALGPVLGGRIDTGQRFSEALTLVYRVLFLLFAESRDLGAVAYPPFDRTYTMTSLCRDASRLNGVVDGIWEGLAALTRLSRSGCDARDLRARPFNGRLFARASAPSVEAAPSPRPTRSTKRRDAALGQALVALASRRGHGGREEISYADLGVEQLGAVYERVLDLDARELFTTAPDAPTPGSSSRGHSARRKETGTFYTPQPLAEFVVRRTLAPLVRNAGTEDILALRIVDPAMGSGAFLVAACRYLADAYERALVAEGRCAETDLDAAAKAGVRRLVAARCLAGVDSNPIAVELARLSLWLTTLCKDKPLGFFDHQLRVGDSLAGTTPDDLWRTRASRRREPSGPLLFDSAGLEHVMRSITRDMRQLRERQDDTVEDVHARERLWSAMAGERSPVAHWRAACDLWCARWFWPDQRAPSPAELRAALDALLHGDFTLPPERLTAWLQTARVVAAERRFFHWPLEFADCYYGADGGPHPRSGFDAVIGNPPWEMLRGAEQSRRATVDFVRESGLYQHCDRGHLNLYQPFLERSLTLVKPGGRVGLILPWSLATDEGASALRQRLQQRTRIDSIVGLDNAAGLFPIHRGLRFMVLVAATECEPRTIPARFGVRTAGEIDDLPEDADQLNRSSFPVRLEPGVLALVGGSTHRIPDVRRPGDLEWLLRITRKFPGLGSADGWNVRFGRELNATDDGKSFGDSGLPVMEGKHIAPFRADASAATRRVLPATARRLLPDGRYEHPRLAYRDVSGAANRRTLIAAIIPAGALTTHTLFCLRTALAADQQAFLCGLFNSATLNRFVRMFMGSHVTTALTESLPIPLWTGDDSQRRVAELARLLAATDDTAARRERELNELVDSMYA